MCLLEKKCLLLFSQKGTYLLCSATGHRSLRIAWVAELQSLAAGILRDFDAVRAALTLPYSNGQTEGQVNKLKNLKRQMYGRANFDVLRRRVLRAA
jgi:transposase